MRKNFVWILRKYWINIFLIMNQSISSDLQSKIYYTIPDYIKMLNSWKWLIKSSTNAIILELMRSGYGLYVSDGLCFLNYYNFIFLHNHFNCTLIFKPSFLCICLTDCISLMQFYCFIRLFDYFYYFIRFVWNNGQWKKN